jgi:hypothetical protein
MMGEGTNRRLHENIVEMGGKLIKAKGRKELKQTLK